MENQVNAKRVNGVTQKRGEVHFTAGVAASDWHEALHDEEE
jgi:hypothetical protein